ncbi:Guanine exchange factor for Rac 30 [Psilocybe cubensis]|nr:Guanine exchange factor for Rac 30 [Psilocybe cubensis]KAH9486751.1 Guanine exchange factor for Rac 30 [Psilocybe cubensis]
MDPALYPDPYPSYRPPLPALSSGASSASTRSSAYTSSGSAQPYPDYSNVHVASPDEDISAIASHALLQMLASDPAQSSSARGPVLRSPDRSRWSEANSAGLRSRSSSLGNGLSSAHPTDFSPPSLSQKPSYDLTWQTVHERDEVLMSEEETDDEPTLDSIDPDPDDKYEERTSAAVVAEEGRGLIVQGDNVPIVQLQIPPGTTHLLIGSSSTPNAVPSFLTSVLPQIAHSLLALDISANFLGALPPVLAVCECLEELNVASNPLRVLPVFLADLLNLRVLIADSTGISTLPDALVDLGKLHTISIRRNKLHALPSWLCLLPALQTLCLDGNPFQGPWKALVDPLLAKVPTTPVYPPSTPMLLPLSASAQSSNADAETDGTDVEDDSDHEGSSPRQAGYVRSPEEEDHTITPERGPLLSRATTSPLPVSPPPSSKPLTRTRTTPNRSYFEQTRTKPGTGVPSDSKARLQPPANKYDAQPSPSAEQHEIRKMKSAGDLRRGRSATTVTEEPSMPGPPITKYQTSLSSSNLLQMAEANANASTSPNSSLADEFNRRFASLGPTSQYGSPSRMPPNAARPMLSKSMWESSPGPYNSPTPPDNLTRASSYSPAAPPRVQHQPPISQVSQELKPSSQRQRPSTRDKGTRWGFLKKMSMGKMKPDPPPSTLSTAASPSSSPNPPRISRPQTSNGTTNPHFGSISRGIDRLSKTPQIDVRLSTTGTIDALPMMSTPQPLPPVSHPPRQDSLAVPSSSLLVPGQPRTTKRRSFLPIDAPGGMASLSIPENSTFVTGVVLSQDGEDQHGGDDARVTTPSPVLDHEQYIRREEDRARDAYMRALRSVMAYLKDMNDLGAFQQQQNMLSMYGSSAQDEHLAARSRRPTVVERESSTASSSSTTMVDSTGHLRSSDSIAGLRSGSSSQTLSVATTDSSGSSEERKFKDDKGKRAMVIREILVTERTYVKGLQELVDIYIKPAATPVNLLSGVGSSKDTAVPASERKIVFGGIDALFSFHHDSFLPALEGAAAPLMRPAAEMQEADADGQLSLSVAKAVGDIFVKHAAFMRMYSSYINNFDSSVQRVKYWTSDKHSPAPPSSGTTLSPSSSTAQLVGLGISMAITSNPNAITDSAAATGIPNLTTSQRKRIKTYLKRCRLNPRHTQLNLEGYLLLPVQRVPRYKLLLEELLRSTPPSPEYMGDDPLDRALAEIALLANNMNEGKRESESRRKLVQWQARIRGKFPSPLVQPHRRLIMDGTLLLTRVVRKAVVSFEAINAQGDASTVQVDCLAPELTPRPLIGILCNDLLVLCRDPSEGQDPNSNVDLWAVLRMQTTPQPASIVHGTSLRLVDNKAILYFDAPTPSAALNWYRAINLHIPASKT